MITFYIETAIKDTRKITNSLLKCLQISFIFLFWKRVNHNCQWDKKKEGPGVMPNARGLTKDNDDISFV